MEKIKGTDITLVLSITVLTALCDVLFYSFIDGKPLKSFLILGSNYIMSLFLWSVLFIAKLIHLRNLLQILAQLVVAIYFCLLVFCWYRFGAPLDKSMIALITGTNNAEVREFFHSYIAPLHLAVMTVSIVLLTILQVWITHKNFQPSTNFIKALAVWTLVACSGVGYSFYTLPGRLEGILRTEQKDLNKYRQNPVMKETTTSHPDILMIIIGESFARNHSSLYGYDKPTNPRLQQEANSGKLIIFKDPVAPATHTAEAFKYFMTTYDKQKTEKEWFKHLTLTEALQCAGYQTAWFSNQAQAGWYDNISAAFAKMCKYICYPSTREDGELGARPDGILLPKVKQYLSNQKPNIRLALFIHLMGQHNDFEQRYTQEFAHFQPTDYLHRLESQRKNYATYDNATLYNDYVVDSLFTMLKGKNAVAVYFSDHGMDFYESAPDYCSHANNSNPTSVHSGLMIPFFLYTTENYLMVHSTFIDRARQTASKTFCTDNLPFLILDAIGYRVEGRKGYQK